jgi:hypothetical protein
VTDREKWKDLLVRQAKAHSGLQCQWKKKCGSHQTKMRLLRLTAITFFSYNRYSRVQKSQLDAQFVLSIFRQSLHVSGVSIPSRTTDSHLKRIISTNCCIHGDR